MKLVLSTFFENWIDFQKEEIWKNLIGPLSFWSRIEK